MKGKTDWSVVASLISLFIVAALLWDTMIIYPVKVFVVLLHELGHGMAALLTGGEIMKIELNSNLGGVCWSRGGWRMAVLPAGYLGSMLFGGLILLGAARSKMDKLLSMFVGGLVILITLLFVRTGFGFVFGLIFGAAMILAGRFLPPRVNDILLKFLGLTSCLYAVVDIKEDLISRTVPGSDAYQMSEEFLLPPVFWGILWIVIAVVVSAFLIRIAARGDH